MHVQRLAKASEVVIKRQCAVLKGVLPSPVLSLVALVFCTGFHISQKKHVGQTLGGLGHDLLSQPSDLLHTHGMWLQQPS
jgi:hypothetical protein